MGLALGRIVLALALAAGSLSPANAVPLPEPVTTEAPLMLASGNCNAVGQRVAAQMGGSFHSASMETQNGQQVCVIIVIIPARDGNRGQRERIVVPL